MNKGFTLIELLIVIAILAILATVIVLVINPAQLFAQARDSQRISDLGTLNKAINYYLVTASVPAFVANGPFTSSASTTCAFNVGCPGTARDGLTAVDGTGWVAIDMSGATGGSPLPRLPLDPVNNATYYYAYRGNASLYYELDGKLESTKFATTAINDGGDTNAWYEVGSLLTM